MIETAQNLIGNLTTLAIGSAVVTAAKSSRGATPPRPVAPDRSGLHRPVTWMAMVGPIS